MKEIPLNTRVKNRHRGKYVALVDDEDFNFINQWNWTACKIGNNLYASRSLKLNGKKTSLRMHRVILNVPKGMYVDHIDLNGLNCQRNNMRICTNAENARNQKSKGGSSQFKGVSWHKLNKRWTANINYNQKIIYLGSFKSEIDAAKAYDIKAKKLHGEFARLNLNL